MTRLLTFLLLAVTPLSAELHVFVVGGLGGEERYDERFGEEIDQLVADEGLRFDAVGAGGRSGGFG